MRRIIAVIAVVVMLGGVYGTTAESGSRLRIVSYNVHGLPHLIAGDAPARRMPRIAEMLVGYDVALLQEDFEYPELLVKSLPTPRPSPARGLQPAIAPCYQRVGQGGQPDCGTAQEQPLEEPAAPSPLLFFLRGSSHRGATLAGRGSSAMV